MKKLILFIVSAMILLLASIETTATESESANRENPATVLCTPDLYELTKLWVNNYAGINNTTEINIQIVNPEELGVEIENKQNLTFISDAHIGTLKDKSVWKVVVGRDVVVAVINTNNPYLEKIRETGMTSSVLAEIFTEGKNPNWGFIDANGLGNPVNPYLSNENTVKESLAEFLATNQENITCIASESSKDLVSALQNDTYGIGFFKLTDIINPADGGILPGITLLPIDRNNSGAMEYFEDIYADLNDFTRGVWIGKYPKSLVGMLYAAGNGVLVNDEQAGFVKWILTDGQMMLESMGVSELGVSEKQSALAKLDNPVVYPETPVNGYATTTIIFLILFGVIIAGIVISLVIGNNRSKREIMKSPEPGNSAVLNQNSLTFPNGMFFDRSHTWAFMETDGYVKVGIDDFLQHVTGNFTRVKMKAPGETIKKNEPLLSLIQDGKQLNVYSPISGTITSVNKLLEGEPSLINKSPYAEGWLYMIEPANWLREIQFLKMAESHKEWLKAEFIKLKEFLSSIVNTTPGASLQLVMQDGGVLKDHVLEDMSPEVWEDFQKRFLDSCGVS